MAPQRYCGKVLLRMQRWDFFFVVTAIFTDEF